MQPVAAPSFPVSLDTATPLRAQLSLLGKSVPQFNSCGGVAERLLALLTSSAVRKGSLEKMQFARCRMDMLCAIDRRVRADKPVCMCALGEWSGALNLAVEMLRSSDDWKYVERRVIANMRFEAAQVYWKNNRFGKRILAAGHAVMTRPMLAGRPLKRWLVRLELL